MFHVEISPVLKFVATVEREAPVQVEVLRVTLPGLAVVGNLGLVGEGGADDDQE